MKWWQRIPYTWRLAFGLWLGMRLLLWGLSAALFYSGALPLVSPFPEAPVALNEGPSGALFGSWLRWDGGFYYWLTTEGYTATPTISAFWPLYPLLAKFFTFFGIHPLIALLLVSNLAFLAALVIFLEEVKDQFGASTMLISGLVALAFPGTFFFYAPFPMSLALLLVLLSYRLARQGKWLASAIPALLSGLTHPTVIPFSIVLLFLAYTGWHKSGQKKELWKLVVPAMPLLGVGIFLAWRMVQGFSAYPNMLASSWGSQIFNPGNALAHLLGSVATGNPLSILKLVIILIAIGAIIWLFHQRRFDLGVYQTALLLYLVSLTVPDHPLGSFIRYFLLGFPIFMTLGFWFRQKRWLGAISIASFAIINLLLCSMYLAWVFVA